MRASNNVFLSFISYSSFTSKKKNHFTFSSIPINIQYTLTQFSIDNKRELFSPFKSSFYTKGSFFFNFLFSFKFSKFKLSILIQQTWLYYNKKTVLVQVVRIDARCTCLEARQLYTFLMLLLFFYIYIFFLLFFNVYFGWMKIVGTITNPGFPYSTLHMWIEDRIRRITTMFEENESHLPPG